MQDATVDACSLINVISAAPILFSASLKGHGSTEQQSGRQPRSIILDPLGTPASAKTPEKQVHHLGLTLHVPAKVADEETLYVLQPDHDDTAKLLKVKIDLDPLLKSGRLHRCDLEGEGESELFVHFATRLDDGEAACLAIAKSRAWSLATDDRKARRIASEEKVHVITTPELMKQWATLSGASDQQVADVLQAIQRFAKFVPHHTSPEYQWWVDHLTTT